MGGFAGKALGFSVVLSLGGGAVLAGSCAFALASGAAEGGGVGAGSGASAGGGVGVSVGLGITTSFSTGFGCSCVFAGVGPGLSGTTIGFVLSRCVSSSITNATTTSPASRSAA